MIGFVWVARTKELDFALYQHCKALSLLFIEVPVKLFVCIPFAQDQSVEHQPGMFEESSYKLNVKLFALLADIRPFDFAGVPKS